MPVPTDPRSTRSLVSATCHLLSCVGERLDTRSTELLRRLRSTEALNPELLLDAGRVLGLAELAHDEAAALAALLLEELPLVAKVSPPPAPPSNAGSPKA